MQCRKGLEAQDFHILANILAAPLAPRSLTGFYGFESSDGMQLRYGWLRWGIAEFFHHGRGCPALRRRFIAGGLQLTCAGMAGIRLPSENLTHFGGKLIRAERFLYELGSRAEHSNIDCGVLRVGRHIEDLQVRP